ncbi:MAG: hypothetical protein Q9227_005486 [Pyrenula ochraceoflavens]
MGIPKLSRDLSRYGETVILGSPVKDDPRHSIDRVVIDGPALVYYISSRILACRNCNTQPLDAQPSNEEVGTNVIQFLRELQIRGVTIDRIYFDGGLPLAKRATRFKRLEQENARLQTYRNVHDNLHKALAVNKKHAIHPLELFDASKIVQPVYRKIPSPPFAVAAVIEDLTRLWTDQDLSKLQQQTLTIPATDGTRARKHAQRPFNPIIVEVVAGEADVSCTTYAKKAGVAILSNDSDILVYDLGDEGSLLQLSSFRSHEGLKEVSCTRFQPRRIARQMQLDLLSKLAFQRHVDANASFAEVLRRARTYSDKAMSSRYQDFMKEYQTSTAMGGDPLKSETLDPRVFELYLQYFEPIFAGVSECHIYLPVLLENPRRTSSWSYGSDIRRLAYSLLNHSAPDSSPYDHIAEYQRRGNQISPVKLTFLSAEQTKAALSEQLGAIRAGTDAFHFPNKDSNLSWLLLGFLIVCKGLKVQNKPPISRIWIEDFVFNHHVSRRLDWDDVHAYANAQAVMYSLKILKQTLTIAKASLPEGLLNSTPPLEETLLPLPPLSRLIVSRHELLPSSESSRDVLRAIGRMYDLLDEKICDT